MIAGRLGAELHDAAGGRQPGADRQDHGATRRPPGIPYQLQNGGTALGVPASDVAQARDRARERRPADAKPRATRRCFNTSSLGESDQQQQIQYQVALEQQLAHTIDQVQGVDSRPGPARDPEPQHQLFSANSTQQATAAVLLSDGSSLDPGSIRGIAAAGCIAASRASR